MTFFEEFQELSEREKFRSPEPLSSDFVELANPVCGDVVQVSVVVSQERLERMEYHHRGCWPVQGCLELLGERLIGQPVARVLKLELSDFLGWVDAVPTSKRHAFSLTHRALRQAILESLVRSEKKGYTEYR